MGQVGKRQELLPKDNSFNQKQTCKFNQVYSPPRKPIDNTTIKNIFNPVVDMLGEYNSCPQIYRFKSILTLRIFYILNYTE